MKLLKSWHLKQHTHLKENERLFLVGLMQLCVFCWGKFIATLLLSGRLVSHKDFQMPCVKFLISPTTLKYIIAQTQTSFKKYLSLKHVWPPCLHLRDLGFFFSVLLSQVGDRTAALPKGLVPMALTSAVILRVRTYCALHPVSQKTWLCQTVTFTCRKSVKIAAELLPQHLSEQL